MILNFIRTHKSLSLFLLSLIFFTSGTICTEIYKIDVRFAYMFEDLLQHKLQMFPTLNGYPYADYLSTYFYFSWISTLGGQWINFWSLTFPTMLCAAFTVSMIFLTGEKLKQGLGIIAAILTLSSFNFIFTGCSFGLDMAVAAAASVMLYFLVTNPFSKKTVILFCLLLFFSVYIRSSLAILTFGAAIAGFILCKGNWKYTFIYGTAGFFILIFSFLSLMGLIYLQGGKELLQLFYDWQVQKRVAGGDYFYYIKSGLFLLAPLSFFALSTFFIFKKKIFSEPYLSLWGFVLLPFFFLSIPGGKHLRYATLILSALSILGAYALDWFLEKDFSFKEKIGKFLLITSGIITLIFAVSVIVCGILIPGFPWINFLLAFIFSALISILMKNDKSFRKRILCSLLFLPVIYCGVIIPLTGFREATADPVREIEKTRTGKLFFFEVGPDHQDLKYCLYVKPEKRKSIEYIYRDRPDPKNHYTKMFRLKQCHIPLKNLNENDIIIVSKKDMKYLEEELSYVSRVIYKHRIVKLGHDKYFAVMATNQPKN